MNSRALTRGRIAAAFTIAIATDIIQIPLVLGFIGATGSGIFAGLDIGIETIYLAIDAMAAVVTCALLGFHWALLPSFVLEAIPILDAAPTWTACVAFVVYKRKQAEKTVDQKPPSTKIVDHSRP